MKNRSSRRWHSVLLLAIALLASAAGRAETYSLNTADASNGIFDIFSTTFDGSLVPCNLPPNPVPYDAATCTFFNGYTPSNRALIITPNPTGIIDGVPGGIAAAPSASYMNLTLANNNTEVTLTGGALKFAELTITISGSTVVLAENAGFVFNAAAQTTAVNASGQATFEVSLAPGIAVDFSTFNDVVTSCTGPLCGLIPILTLDMVRYQLVVDFDDTFSTFTGSLLGQTANNSMVFATINAGPPLLTASDSLPPANDLSLPFGDVTELTTATQTVTLANSGDGILSVGSIGSPNAVAAPFVVANDNCSQSRLASAESCTFDIQFTPSAVNAFSDTFDIPSTSNAQQGTVEFSLSGNGVAAPVPNIVVTDSIAPVNDAQLPFGTQAIGSQSNQTVTVSNNGAADLVIGQIGVPNGLAAPFSVQSDTCSAQTLATSGTCTVTVRFAPSVLGGASDSFNIPSNDPDTASVTVTTTGNGIAVAVPDIRITDPTAPDTDRQLSFDGVRVDGSFDRSITIINDGDADLGPIAIGGSNGLAAPFSIVDGGNECEGVVLGPDQNCTVALRFEPTALGAANDSFSVASNDPDEPSITVSVAGSGVEDPVPDDISPDGADSGFMAIDPSTLGLLAGAAALAARRRRQHAA